MPYQEHVCDGDKCTFPGCMFTVHLSFVLEEAVIDLQGGARTPRPGTRARSLRFVWLLGGGLQRISAPAPVPSPSC